jgi:microcystin-dependent protein
MDLTIGQLVPLPTEYVPTGTLACNGQLVPIAYYPILFDVLGTQFGGDGRSTFGLPNVPPLQPLNGPPINWYMPYDGVWGGTYAVQFLAQVSPLVGVPLNGTQLAQVTAPCNGTLAQIDGTEDSQAIFSLLGTQFGGDGVSTFGYPNIPSMPGTGAQSFPYYMAIDGMYPNTSCDTVTPKYDSGQSLDMYLGTIAMFPYLPKLMNGVCGVALCRGQLIELGASSPWEALYAILGTRYGGNGTTTFGLPNLPDGPGGLTYTMVTAGLYPPRD